MKCFVSACESDFHCIKYIDEPEPTFSVHRFPKDMQRRLIWLQAISTAENRDIHVDEIKFNAIRICSIHFLVSDFYYNKGRKMLHKTAIPSVFLSSSGYVSSLASVDPSLPCTLHDSGISDANCTVISQSTVPEGPAPVSDKNGLPNVPVRVPQKRRRFDDSCDSVGSNQLNIRHDKGYINAHEAVESPSIPQESYPNLSPQKQRRYVGPVELVDSRQLYYSYDYGLNDNGNSPEPLSTNPKPMPESSESPPKIRRRAIRYAGDVKHDITAEEALIAVPKLKVQLTRTQKTVKQLRGQNKRLRDRMTSLQDLFEQLKLKKFISDSNHTVLQEYSANRSLFEELQSRVHGQPYSDALRSFATTLHFYSPKAYTYVRNVFNKTMPHPRTIIRWYESIDGEPGITKESLDALQLKAAEMKFQGQPLLGCLMMDEMAIRQQVVWNEYTKKLEGVAHLHPIQTVDKNDRPNAEQIPAAKEALVFMVTGIQAPWKIPIAYFLIKGLNATEKKEIINTLLDRLHEAGVTIIAITFDGTCTNIATVNALGCDIRAKAKPLKTHFRHPTADHDVYVLLDPVHMLKLIRNTFHKQKILITPNGTAKWEYIEKLHQFQKTLGVKLVPKLDDKHVYFENSKMKVLLAVQVISNSVANALEKLRDTEPGFEDCAATAELLHLFNDLFDITNSMNENADGFKKPLSAENFDLYHHAFEYIENFIENITLSDGTRILDSRCKTGFLGFLVAVESFKNLYRIYVEEMGVLDNLFTYWFSQDHLEHFFGAIRAKSGCNNNPNAAQFKASYKRLIVNNDVTNPATGNCHNFKKMTTLKAVNVSKEESSDNSPEIHVDDWHTDYLLDYDSFKTDIALSLSIKNHAEEVSRKLPGKLKCLLCAASMNKYGMTTIESVCKAAEFEFKMLVDDENNVNIEKYYDYIVANSYLRAQSEITQIFDHFTDHKPCNDDHKSEIIKQIIDIYLNIRFKLYSKKMVSFKPTNRQKLTKLILFDGN